MNKKFTFMVAALLAAGSFSADLLAQTAFTKDDTFSKDTYYLIGDQDKYLQGVEKTVGDNKFTTLADYTTHEISDATLWKIEPVYVNNVLQGFKLHNKKTGDILKLQKAALGDNQKAPKQEVFAWFDDVKAATIESGDYLETADGTWDVKISDYTVSFEKGTGTTLKLFTVDENTNQAEIIKDLNLNMGGNGFTLVPSDDDITVEDENNIFSKQVKAVQLSGVTKDDVTIPAGVYMLVSAPDKFEELYAASTTSAADKIALFEECEFIAVSASENHGTEEVKENGLKFVVKTGAELNKYAQDGENKTTGDDVWVKNAVFNIVEPNKYANPGSYTFHIAEARIIDSSKTDKSHKTVKNLNVGVTTIENVKYVTTTENATEFKAGSSALVKAIELLKEEKAPSVFNIQFLSNEGKENSEYGKYLGVAADNDATSYDRIFAIQGDALVDLSLPQYQFVISKINEKTQEVTFTNIETKQDFTTKLYETSEANVYTLVETTGTNFYLAEDDAEGLGQYKNLSDGIGGMVVKLNPVEVDAYAGFVKLDSNNNMPYKLSFAKNDEIAERLYVVLDSEDENGKKIILSEDDALQVVLEPVMSAANKIAENKVSVPFAYSLDDKYRTASEDMTVYYKYTMRIVDSEDNKYLGLGSSNVLEAVSKDNAKQFVLKYRHDGSIALGTALNESSYRLVSVVPTTRTDNPYAKLSTVYNMYSVPQEDELSLYLEAEKVGVSLEAKSQHVSLESENGGFLNVNEANEGVVAIRTEAAEDLTFWLDTTNSEAFIPSFYISKGGKFMYNSVDSLYNGKSHVATNMTSASKAKYGVGESGNKAKAIFKEGTLVNSDTLKTVVNAKEVLVANKDNQNKGIVKGIEKFQYNIVKASDAEDNYVIRSVGQANTYLANFNGVLGFITDKANAMRVIVETQSAPTSNESVSASEVAVVAQNGSVVVKNAAGKNVVVSTILGQVVANEVLTSDNATINVPAGIVVVAVEGESFKVNVK